MGKTFFFGAGNLYGIDRSAVVPTPVKFGTLQEVTLEFAFSNKELAGQNQFADAIARADGKITGKAKAARISAAAMGGLFFGSAPVTGQVLPVVGELLSIPAVAPYTATVAQGAKFTQNLGVIDALTGNPLTRVGANPATGQYGLVEATGTFTFAAADQGKLVKVDYLYTDPTQGLTLTIVNQQMGAAPSFMTILNGTFDSNSVVAIFNKCISDKLTFPTKKGDYAIPEFDFAAQADDADEIGLLSAPQ